MKKLKKMSCSCIALAVGLTLFAGCSGGKSKTSSENGAVEIKVFSDSAPNETSNSYIAVVSLNLYGGCACRL